jgi:hypothetical protein
MRGRAIPTEVALKKLWSLKREAGGRDELVRWIDEYPEPRRGKPGRHRDDFFKDFSVSKLPWKGLYLVQFRTASRTPVFCVIVRPKANRVKPGGPPRTWVESEHGSDYPTPHEAFCEIVKKTDQEARRGAQVDSIARRLTGEFRKQVRALDSM